MRQYVKERISLQKIEAAEQKKREASEAKKAWHEAVKKAKRAAQRAEILKNIDVDQLGVGSECPFCGRNLRIVKTVRRTSRSEFVETTKKLTCGDAQCDSTFLEVTVMTPSEDFGSVASVCHSCTQPIRDGSFCGCS